MPGLLRDYFVVLPDSVAGHTVAGQLPAPEATGAASAPTMTGPVSAPTGTGPVSAPTATGAASAPAATGAGTGDVLTVPHPSGRPWVLARPRFRKVSHLRRGNDALVLIGPDRVPEAVLAGLLEGARDRAALERRLAQLPGLQHVVAHLSGETWIRGTASGLRRIYHARHPQAGTIASDRPAVLAHLTGAPLDDGALALRMLDFLPHPLSRRALWRGVHETGAGYGLALPVAAPGTAAAPGPREYRWWEPPPPELSLAEGARRVGEAVAASVRAHVGGLDRISCELSGGLDSTALTFAARATGPAELSLLTVAARDRYSEDETWARRAVEEAHGPTDALAHHIIPADQAPYFYADLTAASAELNDEPLPVAPGRARAHLLLSRAHATGSRYHLTGYGGDELFLGLPHAYQDLFHGNPLTAWNHLSGLRHQLGWPLLPTLKALLNRSTFPQWLAGAVTTEPQPVTRTPLLSWGVRQSLRPWFTDHARTLITEEFRTAAERAEPIDRWRGRHVDIDAVRMGARHFQAMEDIGMTIGLPVAAPFYDDRVLEATLAVRLPERISPWRYKPLLVEAMRGVVPDALLARTTKDHMSSDEHQGLREHAPELADLWTGSRLAEHGLVDARHLLRLAAEPFSPVLVEHSISSTVAGETWLRTAENAWPTPQLTPTPTTSEALQ
ncbi:MULTISPECIES: asparagine synthase-related protein [Streptomyces]|uniref:asparagine synthase-related protein n=1 Tax=Streptomyces TaxID=1883 RepID=UPI00103E5804|nr:MULTISPECIES: asparagine synthase-related protein [Streptomyces]MBT3076526.1 asparagine synthase [Streptomyces sp. COG21]MBT3078960.1 asparagine synthase [Streptomyces sp. COG20]MBT3087829.1 asparagine synthase [Streptomyces sp. CYG21]MBT3107174.1 asparagine synthase [Streptomyces sp. COG19]MBT3109222.1 asparagine synthase [Streptomyces sp. CYG20]